MTDLRDTIARAMQRSDAWMGCDDEGWTCPGKDCRYCWEVAQGCADAVIAALGPLRPVYNPDDVDPVGVAMDDVVQRAAANDYTAAAQLCRGD